MPVIPVNKVVDPKRIIGKKWRAEEEERHKGLLTKNLFTYTTKQFGDQLKKLPFFNVRLPVQRFLWFWQ
jgi:hypothetical protein